MRHIKLGVALALVLLAGMAYAQSNGLINIDFAPRLTQGGLYIGNLGGAASANRITQAFAGTITHDFASQTITCVDSASITVTGAKVGDPCFVGLNAAPGNANFTCYVSALNTVLVHFCPAGTAVDPASQLFAVRVLSAQ